MMKSNLIATIVLMATAAASPRGEAKERATQTPVETTRIALAKDIRRTLKASGADENSLRQLADHVALVSPNNALIQSLLSSVRSPAAPAKSLRAALSEVADILSFQIVDEAPLPSGYPQPTPVGEIHVRQYPAYRMARTAMEPGEGSAFWSLFRHIQSQNIAMTSPVEMTYTTAGERAEAKTDPEPRETSMAFLYRSTEQGKIGNDGMVEVIDRPPLLAVSIGCRGDITPASVAAARKLLEASLAEYQNRYAVAGDLRVLGYNSPFVPVNKRYFEVQIPITKR